MYKTYTAIIVSRDIRLVSMAFYKFDGNTDSQRGEYLYSVFWWLDMETGTWGDPYIEFPVMPYTAEGLKGLLDRAREASYTYGNDPLPPDKALKDLLSVGLVLIDSASPRPIPVEPDWSLFEVDPKELDEFWYGD